MTTFFDPLNDSATGTVDAGAHVVRHPSTALYDRTFDTFMPSLIELGFRKNIPLRLDEHAPLLRHALEHVSRRTMRRVMNCDADAIMSVTVAIDRTLNILAAARMLAACEAIMGNIMPDAATLIARAEEAMKPQFANDKVAGWTVWPDLSAIAKEYYRRESEHMSRPSFVKLPGGTNARVKLTPSNKRWSDVIKAATPALEDLADG